MTRTTAHITIDAIVEEAEIRGQISCGVGESRQFSGWLALISALDDLLTGPGIGDSAETRPDRTAD